jgi:hypothetical protein
VHGLQLIHQELGLVPILLISAYLVGVVRYLLLQVGYLALESQYVGVVFFAFLDVRCQLCLYLFYKSNKLRESLLRDISVMLKIGAHALNLGI